MLPCDSPCLNFSSARFSRIQENHCRCMVNAVLILETERPNNILDHIFCLQKMEIRFTHRFKIVIEINMCDSNLILDLLDWAFFFFVFFEKPAGLSIEWQVLRGLDVTTRTRRRTKLEIVRDICWQENIEVSFTKLALLINTGVRHFLLTTKLF